MGQLWAVQLRMKTVGSAPDEKSFYGVANKRDQCTMMSFSRSKRKFQLVCSHCHGLTLLGLFSSLLSRLC